MAKKNSNQDPTHALTIKLDNKKLKKLYPSDHWRNGWRTVRQLLQHKGFTLQGKVYVGKPNATAENCVEAILYLKSKIQWFWESVKDIKMIRVRPPVDVLESLRKIYDSE